MFAYYILANHTNIEYNILNMNIEDNLSKLLWSLSQESTEESQPQYLTEEKIAALLAQCDARKKADEEGRIDPK